MTQEANFQAPPTAPKLSSSPFPGAIGDLKLPGRVGRLETDMWELAAYVTLVAEVANGARAGKISSKGTVTLTENTTTTTLSDKAIHPSCAILLEPTTANGAAERGGTALYVSAKTNESATITHANNAQTDRTFDYFVVG